MPRRPPPRRTLARVERQRRAGPRLDTADAQEAAASKGTGTVEPLSKTRAPALDSDPLDDPRGPEPEDDGHG